MLSTRLIMTVSSAALGLAGVACLFLPEELGRNFGMAGDRLSGGFVAVQIAGSLYLGLAAANWTARGSMIGGIYARPLSVANFFHFVVGAAVLARGIRGELPSPLYLTVTLAYVALAVCFTLVLLGKFAATRNSRAEKDNQV